MWIHLIKYYLLFSSGLQRATLGYDDLPGIPKFASPEVHNDRLQEIWAREMACKTRAPSLARALLAFTKPWLQVSVALMWTMMAFNLAVPVLSGLLVRVRRFGLKYVSVV